MLESMPRFTKRPAIDGNHHGCISSSADYNAIGADGCAASIGALVYPAAFHWFLLQNATGRANIAS